MCLRDDIVDSGSRASFRSSEPLDAMLTSEKWDLVEEIEVSNCLSIRAHSVTFDLPGTKSFPKKALSGERRNKCQFLDTVHVCGIATR